MHALLKMRIDGGYEVFADNCAGESFLFLNDLAFAPNGDLYLTDSGIALDVIAPDGELSPRFRELDYDGRIYRIDVNSGAVEVIDRGILFTNGIAFGPDENLYIAESLTGDVFRYAYRDGKIIGGREVFGNVVERFDPADLKG